MMSMVFIWFTQPIHKEYNMKQWSIEYRNSDVFDIHGSEIPLDVFVHYVDDAYKIHEVKIKVPETLEDIGKW